MAGTISQEVKNIIDKSPFLSEMLVRDIVSYSNLANEIKPAVEERLTKAVNSPAIVMALRRYADELRDEAVNRIKNSLMMSEIAKLENIQITAQDLDQKLSEMADLYHTNKDAILNEIRKNASLIQSLSQQALSQKVTKFLIDNNNIKFVAEAKK